MNRAINLRPQTAECLQQNQPRDLLVFQFYVLSTSDNAPEDQDG